jgi:hypothetical protein
VNKPRHVTDVYKTPAAFRKHRARQRVPPLKPKTDCFHLLQSIAGRTGNVLSLPSAR